MITKRDRRTGTTAPRRAEKAPKKGERKLNRLLTQLIASAAIFLLVFVGGGLVPEHVFDVFGSVRQVISGDQSLVKSVEALGEAVSAGENWPKAVRDWCVDTFLPTGIEEPTPEDSAAWLDAATRFHLHLAPQTSSTTSQGLSEPQSAQQ